MNTAKQIDQTTSILDAEGIPQGATVVADNDRLRFLPKLFGSQNMLIGEVTVYHYMERMNSKYSGGFWDFFELPSGAMYMVPPKPATDQMLSLSWDGNGFEGQVSRHSAGIIVTLMALSAMSFRDPNGPCAENFHLLRDVLIDHPEAGLIYRAID